MKITPKPLHYSLGTVGMICSPLILASLLLLRVERVPGGNMAAWDGALSTIYIVGWLCSAIGLHRLRVMGRGPAAAVVFAIQLAGLALAGIWELLITLRPHADSPGWLFDVIDPAWPFSHVFMLVVGIAVILAGRWRGWRRFAPLACGLVSGATLAAFFYTGRQGMEITFGLYTAAFWMLLGYAVRTGDRGFAPVPSAAGR